MYKTGLFIGRMQHIHSLHEYIINKGLEQCETLLVLVGSSQIGANSLSELTERNPFPADLRIKLIKEIYKEEINNGRLIVAGIPDYTDENDICYEWGDYLLKWAEGTLWENNIGTKLDYMIYGADENREGWFDPESITNVHMEKVERVEGTVSATQLRNYLWHDDQIEWCRNVNPAIHKYYNILKGYVDFATIYGNNAR